MPDQTKAMRPLVESSVAVHRSGFGVLRLGYLPAVPAPGLSEDEVRASITRLDLTLTEKSCAELIEILTELNEQMTKLKRTRLLS